uniref:hypothetical protein n=1 Tax=Neorhizobium sp. EC2-8 TaxID=3129230 RepID=UPI0031014C59
MDNEKQHFYLFGRRIASGIYDPVTRALRLIYRSGRERIYFNISPIQILALLSSTRLKNRAQAWLSVFSPLSFLC